MKKEERTLDRFSSSGQPRSRLELLFRMLGFTLLGIYVLARLHGFLWNYAAVEAQSLKFQTEPTVASSVDFSLWNPKRIQAYKESLLQKFDPPLAIMRIESIRLKVGVFEGTDELTLNRAVGHISGTAPIGSGGNIGIAGHRDGFFRGLKDLNLGDNIELTYSGERHAYTVDSIRIVKPEDVWVLAPRSNPSLTLVTCYPFYFVGNAPERYIIQASLVRNQPITTPIKTIRR
jgi:sortase A